MVAGIWGQTRNLDDRTFDPLDLSKRRSGGPSLLWRPEWGQTRSYGDTYHWVLPVGTVASLSAAPVFVFRGRKPGGAGDKVAADIFQPGGAEISDQLGAGSASLGVRQLWFRLRRAGRFPG